MSLSHLVDAIAKLNSAGNLAKVAVYRVANEVTESVQGFYLEDTGSVATNVMALESEQERIAAQMAAQSKLAATLLGENSSPVAMQNYLQARADLVAMEKAAQQGVFSAAETEEGLREFRHKLRAARIAATDAGGDVAGAEDSSSVRTSMAARLSGQVDALGSIVKGALGAGIDQMAGIGSGLAGLMRGTPLAGGLFGLMMHGYKEDDRLRTQLGELVNLATAAGEDAANPQVAKLAAFQEQAQRYMGVGRREVQANLKTYIDAGISFSEIFKQEGQGLGQVGESAVHMSLALDKHLELAAGTTSREAVKAVRDYGMTLSGALDTITRVIFAARKAGAGAQEFVAWMFQAAGSVRGLGIGIEDAAVAALTLQRELQQRGAPQDLAMTTAQQGVQEMYGGIARRSTGEQVDFAERLGFGDGLEGRQAYREGMAGRPDMQNKIVEMLYKDATVAGGGDENQSRFYLEQKGYGFEGARAIMALGPKLKDGVAVTELDNDEREALKSTFKTEAMKTSEYQKDMKMMLDGMAEMGRNLLAILSNFAAIAITGMIALPILIAGKPEDKDRVYEKLLGYQREVYKSWTGILKGGDMVLEGAAKALLPLIRPITKALAFDVRGPAGMEVAPSATPEAASNVLNDAFRKLTGKAMTPAEEAVLTGVTGLPKAEIERLSGTKEGQEVLANAIAASRRAAAGKADTNPVTGAGFKPGPAASGPASAVMPSWTGGHIGLGSLGDTPLPPEPIPATPNTPHGPTGALVPVKGTDWRVPNGYRGPLEVTVEVSTG